MGNYIPFRLPFQGQENNAVEEIGSNLAMSYLFPPKSGSCFANHFIMAGEKFENTTPENFLCGENNDLNYLTNKPIPIVSQTLIAYGNNKKYMKISKKRAYKTFPYQSASSEEPSHTIRSLVHLRRDSLKLTRVEQAGCEESDLYRVECIFDTDVPCAVRIFLMATEDLSNGSAKYKTKKQDYVSEPIMFDCGPGQVFKSKFYIKPSDFQPAELNYIPNAIEIPLVVQITAEDSGQSESTFAGIEKLSEGSFAIRFMKQKIMVDGLCFMTQEIYGIENKTAAQKAEDDEPEEDNTECIICMTNIRDTLMLPCRHLCLCNICAEEMRTTQSRCPICRAHFHALLQIKGVRRKRKTAEQVSGTESVEEFEEVSIIEALNGELHAASEVEEEGDLKRRSSSQRSRRSRPRSAKSSRSETRSTRSSTRSVKDVSNTPKESADEPHPPTLSSAPPLPTAYIEMLYQKQPQIDELDCDDTEEGDDRTPYGAHPKNKGLSSIVVDSIDIPNSADDKTRTPHLDPSLPGTPMGSDTTESHVVSLNSSIASSTGKTSSHFSTRAQITTPSSVNVDDCLPSPSSSPDTSTSVDVLGTGERV